MIYDLSTVALRGQISWETTEIRLNSETSSHSDNVSVSGGHLRASNLLLLHTDVFWWLFFVSPGNTDI